MTGEPLLLTVEDCAKRLQIGRTNTYRLVISGALPSVRIGKSRRIPASALEGFVEALAEEQRQREAGEAAR